MSDYRDEKDGLGLRQANQMVSHDICLKIYRSLVRNDHRGASGLHDIMASVQP